MGTWYDGDGFALYVGQHQRELRAAAARDHLARQVRRARNTRRALPLRAHVGRLLIVAGERLARPQLELEVACPERA